MTYFGQEVGEPARGAEGFGGEDNRTSIFDYWGVPEHQKWMNNGAFDGGQLGTEQKELRNYYVKLLQFAGTSEAIAKGELWEVPTGGNMNQIAHRLNLGAISLGAPHGGARCMAAFRR